MRNNSLNINSLSLINSPDLIQLSISNRGGAGSLGTVQNQGAVRKSLALGSHMFAVVTYLHAELFHPPSHSQHMFLSVTVRAAFSHQMAVESLISSVCTRETDVTLTPAHAFTHAYACKLILFPSE